MSPLNLRRSARMDLDICKGLMSGSYGQTSAFNIIQSPEACVALQVRKSPLAALQQRLSITVT